MCGCYIMPHYQPQFSITTGELVGLEALLRWNDPDSGPVACVFHGKLDTDSTASWTVIPRQAGHLFQGKLDG